MAKQRVTFTRVETIAFEFDYKVDPHTKANMEFWANQGYCGVSPIGKLGTEQPLASLLSEWKLSKSEPPATVVPTEIPISSTKRKGKAHVR